MYKCLILQVSARFWLLDCRNVPEATKMATSLYKEAIHVPFMAKFVIFSKRHEQLEVSGIPKRNFGEKAVPPKLLELIKKMRYWSI